MPQIEQTTRRNVVFVNFSRIYGGGEQWHFLSAQELQRRGHAVTILANEASELAERAARAGIPCWTMRVSNLSWLNPLTFVQLQRFFKQIRPDSVILNSSVELKTAGVAAKSARIKQIIYRRGIPKPVKTTRLNRLLFLHVVTDLLANSRSTAQALHDIARASGRMPPRIIYNGIETAISLRSNPRSRTIGVVARLSHEKGVDVAIRVLAQVRTQLSDVTLMIIGDGPEKAALQELTAQLGLREQVEFVGFTEQVSRYLSQCAILLMPSRWEGFSNVLLEAMLLRMPCLAFGGQDAHESILHGETGYLVEQGRLDEMAARIVELFASPENIIDMGDAGYERVCREYSLTRAIDQLEELFG
ncbi:glycosyl transferase group 1 [Candidatus Moduliflexus flocculans]|uniref:Glycosyl transferase group 1 n=1 Tax=Candidatus Moduliflexus flocculans TaxID=1499966 RepID=A0A0S6VTQ5_9BACT|nr:glycosyl transferase group 1 [Candidatus Moduliflexus flocculans]